MFAVSAAFAAPTHAAAPSATELVSSTTNGTPLTALAAKQSSPPANACPYYYLCFWKHSNYSSGPWVRFYYCGVDRLTNVYWNDSFLDSVNNDTSSLVNNQTAGTISVFWDSLSTYGDWFQQHAYGYRDNLVIDGWNDRISTVLIC